MLRLYWLFKTISYSFWHIYEYIILIFRKEGTVCPFGGDLAGQSRVHCQKIKLELCLEYSFADMLRKQLIKCDLSFKLDDLRWLIFLQFSLLKPHKHMVANSLIKGCRLTSLSKWNYILVFKRRLMMVLNENSFKTLNTL